MNFQKLRNLRDIDVILANPNYKELGVLPASNIVTSLRLNDISELSMSVWQYVANAQGKNVRHPQYSKVQAQRLIYIDALGWWKITNCEEVGNGLNRHKSIRCHSIQKNLDNFGLFIENKPYCLFNKEDPYDNRYKELEARAEYTPEDMQKFKEAIPSVVGEIYQQLQIEINPRVILEDDLKPYGFTEPNEDWTVEFISSALKDGVVRSFDDSKIYNGYDFLQNQVATKFEVLILFDFRRHAIQIKTVDEVTEPTNIYLDYSNVVRELKTTEKADDVCTAYNVSGGNGLEIRSVNPTGDNTVTNFEFYKYNLDADSGEWMSKELTERINDWEAKVKKVMTPPEGEKYGEWEKLVLELRDLYQERTELLNERTYYNLKHQDLTAAESKGLTANKDGIKTYGDLEKAGALFTAEEVEIDELSLDDLSKFKNETFSKDKEWVCYKKQPTFIQEDKIIVEDGEEKIVWSGKFSFEGQEGNYASFNDNYLEDSDNPEGNPNISTMPQGGYLYFADPDSNDNLTYCKLIGGVVEVTPDDPETPQDETRAEYQVVRFARYTTFGNLKDWIKKYHDFVVALDDAIKIKNNEINDVIADMEEISSELNLHKQFDINNSDAKVKASERKLYRELKSYYLEQNYENTGYSLYDDTTPEEAIDLARELYANAKEVIVRSAQSTFSITIDSINFTRIKEFDAFSRELELGKVVTVCKSEEEGIHYYPALTGINLALDDPDGEFSLEFSSSLRPTSSEFMYMDLIHKGGDAFKTIAASQQNWTKYARNEATINGMLFDSLSNTLRISQGNMVLQEFAVSPEGVILRKFTDEERSSFDPRQARLLANTFLFTRDNWVTASTAVGEISFQDPETGDWVTGYGIAAENLVGSVIIGEALFIKNKNNTISLAEDGITIKAPKKNPDGTIMKDASGNIVYEVVFNASPEGSVSLKGHIEATSGKIGELTLKDGNLHSRNFEISTTPDGTSRLAFYGTDDMESTQVGDAGIYSPKIEGRTLTAGEELYVGGRGGLKISNYTIATDDENNVSIEINAGSTNMQQYIATVAFAENDDGFKISLDNSLIRQKTFVVYALIRSYSAPGWSTTKTYSITLEEGETVQTFPINAGNGNYVADFYFVNTGTRTQSFTISSGTTSVKINTGSVGEYTGLFINGQEVVVDGENFLKIR